MARTSNPLGRRGQISDEADIINAPDGWTIEMTGKSEHESGSGERAIIDAGYVKLLLSGALQAGYDVAGILRRAGIDPDILDKSAARLSQRQLAQLIYLLTRMTRDEAWALLSRPIKPGTFRILCSLMVRCTTLREALKTGCHFYHLMVDDFVLRLESDDREACLWVVDSIPDIDRKRMLNGAAIFFLYGLMCWLVGRKLPLTTVHCNFPWLPRSADLAPVYEATVLFDQRRTEIRFDAAILDLPIIPDEERLRRFLATVPSVLLVRYRDETSFFERVRGILRRNLHGMLSLEDVAQRLNMSPQTLRRRLQEDSGCGFQEIKDQVRRDVAIHLLEKSRLSIEEVGSHLGFSEVSTFHRAFRRWTGHPPGRYRQISKAN